MSKLPTKVKLVGREGTKQEWMVLHCEGMKVEKLLLRHWPGNTSSVRAEFLTGRCLVTTSTVRAAHRVVDMFAMETPANVLNEVLHNPEIVQMTIVRDEDRLSLTLEGEAAAQMGMAAVRGAEEGRGPRKIPLTGKASRRSCRGDILPKAARASKRSRG